MYWAYKRTNGHTTVQEYSSIDAIKEIHKDWQVAKIILPYEADDLKHAAVQAGNRLDGGKFTLMEQQKNGLEIPRRYE